MKKRTLKKYNNAGVVTKQPFNQTPTGAGVAAGVSMVPMLTSFIPKNSYTDNEGNDLGSVNSMGADVLEGAAMGAQIDIATGGATMGLGTLAGGLYGAGKNWLGSNEMNDKRDIANRNNTTRSLNNRMTSNQSQMSKQNYNNNNMVFANGGTVLNEGQNIAYNNWLKKNNIQETNDYDMKGYWKETGFKGLPHKGHFPDTYKMSDFTPFKNNGGDNYELLSDESKYANKFDKRGQGFWGNNDQMIAYANGGMININSDVSNATEEVEGGESAVTPDGQHIQFNGPSHEEGGIETNLPEKTFIFSDRLKMGKKTFASLAKPIQNKIAKTEEKNDKFSANTKKLFEMQLNHLAESQEDLKQEQEMKKQAKFAKGGFKYNEGGPTIGRINPKTGKPFTSYEVALYHQSPLPEVFGQEYIGESNNGNRIFQPIPESNTGNPFPTFKRSVNQNPNFPTNESYGWNTNPAMINIPVKQNYETPILPNNPSYNLNQPVAPIQPVIPNLNKENYVPSTAPIKTNNINWNEMGQIGSGIASNIIQNNRVNNAARPRTLNEVRINSQGNPRYVNLSGQRNAISRIASGARDEAQRSFGNSATIQAFKNKARLNELQGLGESYQNQENLNADIYNKDLGMKNEMFTKQQLTNAEINKLNAENAYGDEMSRVAAKNMGTATLANTAGQVFGNRTAYNNQLDAAGIYANARERTVQDQMIEGSPQQLELFRKATPEKQKEINAQRVKQGKLPLGAYGGFTGGKLIDVYANGGSTRSNYHQELYNKALNDKTITDAQTMDNEYSAAIDIKLYNPKKRTLKSKK